MTRANENHWGSLVFQTPMPMRIWKFTRADETHGGFLVFQSLVQMRIKEVCRFSRE
jgi:hypothetical protein